MFRYPWPLLPKLASEVEHYQREASNRDLESLLQITLKQSKYRLGLWKFRCAQVGSASMRGAMKGGASSDILLEEHLQMLDRLNSLKSKKQIKILMHRYLGQLLEHVRPAQRTNIESAVDQIRKKICCSLDTPHSLAQYAHALGVSTAHLSRSFCKIVGHPFREEVRRSRAEVACRLLSQTSLKISMVAQRVGIRDPSHFIANFRSEKGMTPGQYRNIHYRYRSIL